MPQLPGIVICRALSDERSAKSKVTAPHIRSADNSCIAPNSSFTLLVIPVQAAQTLLPAFNGLVKLLLKLQTTVLVLLVLSGVFVHTYGHIFLTITDHHLKWWSVISDTNEV